MSNMPGDPIAASRLARIRQETVAWVKTLGSAVIYATLLITFVGQVARVEGTSMAPTLQDQDRLIVNKLTYHLADPKVGDIVMLYYPLKPEKSFVKRIIALEGDQLRIVDGHVFRNDVPLDDSFVPPEYRSHGDWGPKVIPEGYCFVMATIATTASTAATGASYRRSTSRARCRCGGGRWATPGCFEVHRQ
jgi:signal peptidase I